MHNIWIQKFEDLTDYLFSMHIAETNQKVMYECHGITHNHFPFDDSIELFSFSVPFNGIIFSRVQNQVGTTNPQLVLSVSRLFDKDVVEYYEFRNLKIKNISRIFGSNHMNVSLVFETVDRLSN